MTFLQMPRHGGRVSLIRTELVPLRYRVTLYWQDASESVDSSGTAFCSEPIDAPAWLAQFAIQVLAQAARDERPPRRVLRWRAGPA